MTVSAIGDRQMRQHHGATWLDSEHHPAKRVTTSLPLHGQRHHVAAVDFRTVGDHKSVCSHEYRGRSTAAVEPDCRPSPRSGARNGPGESFLRTTLRGARTDCYGARSRRRREYQHGRREDNEQPNRAACRWSSYRSACLAPGTSRRITKCSVRGCPTLSDEPILRPDVDDRRVRAVLGRIVNVTTDILDGRIVLDLVGRGRVVSIHRDAVRWTARHEVGSEVVAGRVEGQPEPAASYHIAPNDVIETMGAGARDIPPNHHVQFH